MVVMAASGVSVSHVPVLTKASNVLVNPAVKPVTICRKMSSFAGMKAESQVNRLGSSLSTEEHFARIVLAQARAGASGRGSAAASTCTIASEILRVVPIMSGLVLVGVALGFVLLRVEAAIEEAEE